MRARSLPRNLVRAFREELGLNLFELCSKARISEATLKRMEAASAPVSRLMKFKVLKALNKIRNSQNQAELGFSDVFPNEPNPFDLKTE
jgi:hypothetical protein